MIWEFIQNQILGMKWLNELIGNALTMMGLDINTRVGGSIQFFIYDVLKITVLIYSFVYRIYKCRTSVRSNLFLFDFISYG